MKILIIVFKGIGDVLLTTPLVRAIKKNRVDVEIYFFTKKRCEKALKYNPYLSGILIRGETAFWEIRRRKFDLVIDYMLSSVSGLYARFSGAQKRLAFWRPHGFLFYNLMPRFKKKGYTIYDRLQLLDPLGINYDGISIDLKYGSENAAKVSSFFEKNGLDPGKDFIVTFHLTSSTPERRWSGPKFAELADLLSAEHRAKVIFLRGPGEFSYVENVMALCRKNHIITPDFDILDLAALMHNSGLHVGGTSGPMHIAVSQNTPTFTIYNHIESPQSWGPPDKIHQYIQGDLNKLSAIHVFEELEKHVTNVS
ncbi:MAG: glycosyltransferase family 9 protein [Elusimicrobia bacterium]|nr:glycosyltransferase family 9 protein [Elusimicrobiota bacterium]